MHGADLSFLLSRPRPLVLDGAVGTELARRGIPTTTPLWSAHALFSDEGLRTLAAIHADYARAGAEVLVTNTFRTTLRALEAAGRGADWRRANELAVECAREGASESDGSCLVAGSIAPLEDCYSPNRVPPEATCLVEHRRQVRLLAELGVDLIWIETMNARREALAATVAAKESGLDFVVSLCPKPPEHLLSGEALAGVVDEIVAAAGAGLRALLINCAAPEELEAIFPRFASLAPGVPHGLYAHLGERDEAVGWRLPARHDPLRYADWAVRRVGEGARLLGGCCGTTPDHVAALRRAVDA